MGVPTDALTRNGWVLDIAGAPPDLHFRKVSGLERTQDSVKMTDGATRALHWFNDGVIKYGTDVKFVRVPDGGPGDAYLEELLLKCLHENYKFEATLHKYHGGVEVKTIEMSGVRFVGENHPEWDADADGEGARFDLEYTVTIDKWDYA